MKSCPKELRVVGWDQVPGEKGPESGGGGGLGSKVPHSLFGMCENGEGKEVTL